VGKAEQWGLHRPRLSQAENTALPIRCRNSVVASNCTRSRAAAYHRNQVIAFNFGISSIQFASEADRFRSLLYFRFLDFSSAKVLPLNRDHPPDGSLTKLGRKKWSSLRPAVWTQGAATRASSVFDALPVDPLSLGLRNASSSRATNDRASSTNAGPRSSLGQSGDESRNSGRNVGSRYEPRLLARMNGLTNNSRPVRDPAKPSLTCPASGPTISAQ